MISMSTPLGPDARALRPADPAHRRRGVRPRPGSRNVAAIDRWPTGVVGDKTRESSAMTPPRGSMCPVPDRLGLRRKPHDEADGGVRMKHRIAAIPGDGIGKEVVPEGMRVLDAAGRRFGFDIEWTTFDWSCERFTETGRMMPEDGLDRLRQFESIFLGAVGFPGVPGHVSLWGLLIPIRRGFHQYVNLRPVRLLNGVKSPLARRRPAVL